MKLFLLVLAITINLCYSAPHHHYGNFTSELAKIKASLLEALKEKCYKNSTESYQRLTNLTDGIAKCVETTMGHSPIFVTPLKTLKDNIQSCANEFIEELEDCLPEDSKDWPQLNFDIAYSFLDFLYDNKDQLLSPKTRRFIQNCVETLHEQGASSGFGHCFNFFNDKLAVKASCQELIETEKCIAIGMNKTCPGDESIETLKMGFFAALKEPCAEYDVTENPMDNVFTLLSHYAPPNINPDLM